MGGSCSVRFEEKDISCRIEDGVVQWHHTSFQGPKNVILVVLGGRLLLFRSTKDYERRRACQQVNLQNYMINENPLVANSRVRESRFSVQFLIKMMNSGELLCDTEFRLFRLFELYLNDQQSKNRLLQHVYQHGATRLTPQVAVGQAAAMTMAYPEYHGDPGVKMYQMAMVNAGQASQSAPSASYNYQHQQQDLNHLSRVIDFSSPVHYASENPELASATAPPMEGKTLGQETGCKKDTEEVIPNCLKEVMEDPEARVHVYKLFRHYDQSGTGYLEAIEVFKLAEDVSILIGGHKEGISFEMAGEIMKALDTAKDGRVSFDELLDNGKEIQRIYLKHRDIYLKQQTSAEENRIEKKL